VGRIDERELARVDKSNYKGTTHIGKLGLERYYEDLLHGQVGYQQVEVNAQGRHLRVLERQPPVAGRDLVLALDAGLQAVAESAMAGHSGAVVALDPRSGDVLAMVSMPNYDPNLFVNGISRKDYAALRDDPEQPLFNRPLSGQYPPGSTIKPQMALAGLHYQVTWAGKTMYAGPYYQLKNDPRKYRAVPFRARPQDRHRHHRRAPRAATLARMEARGLSPALVPGRDPDRRHWAGLYAGHAIAARRGHRNHRHPRQAHAATAGARDPRSSHGQRVPTAGSAGGYGRGVESAVLGSGDPLHGAGGACQKRHRLLAHRPGA